VVSSPQAVRITKSSPQSCTNVCGLVLNVTYCASATGEKMFRAGVCGFAANFKERKHSPKGNLKKK
jgi:hypothetical protein